MNFEIIVLLTEIVLFIICLIFLKFFPKNTDSNLSKLSWLAKWAYKLVINARNVLDEATGEEKKEIVCERLKDISENNGILLSDVQLSALVEDAYEKMLSSESANRYKEVM